MKLVFVEELPEKRRSKHRLQILIEEFANGENEVARIDLDEHDYKSPRVCYSCMLTAVKRSARRVKVRMRDNDVYLVKN